MRLFSQTQEREEDIDTHIRSWPLLSDFSLFTDVYQSERDNYL